MYPINWKSLLPIVAAIVLFYALCLVYFSPMLEGQQLIQHDIKQWKGMAQEVEEHRELHDEEALWTGSMFSGMPAYQISVRWTSNLLTHVHDLFQGFLPRPASFLFLYLIGMYVLLRILKIDPWLSIVGAIAFAFSSYFFVILPAGHTSKASAIGYMPLVLGGVYLLYRSRRMLLGAAMLGLFLALEIMMNHVQVTYYLAILILLFLLAEFVASFRSGTLIAFMKRSGLGLVAVALALGCNLGLLWSTWEYGQYTTRGPGELTIRADGSPADEVKTSGLDRDYVTRWSYGIEESFSLLIPDAKGGSTGQIGGNEPSLENADRQFRQYVAQQNRYWGDQTFTSGPVYVGAIVVLLMLLMLAQTHARARWWIIASIPVILLLLNIGEPVIAFAVVEAYLIAGLFLWREPLPYALFSAFVLALLLSWGRNYMPLTDFFLDHVPGYNKFRAVTIVLVIVSLAAPLLGILYLDQLLRSEKWTDRMQKRSLITIGIAAGLLLVVAITPGTFFDFVSENEREAFSAQAESSPEAEAQIVSFVGSLKAVREGIFTADVWRSLGFIIAAALLIVLFGRRTIGAGVMIGGLGVLILADLWAVDKRYMHNEKVRGRYAQWEPKGVGPYVPNAADLTIVEKEMDASAEAWYQKALEKAREETGSPRIDKEKDQQLKFAAVRRTGDHRVLNLASSLDSDGRTSYFHRSIGGYHGAKLQRYDELISFHLSPALQRIATELQSGTSLPQIDSLLAREGVLNMLNARYIVYNAERPPIENLNALGAAWFVGSVQWVENADDEIMELGSIDPSEVVLIDQRYRGTLGQGPFNSDPSASVELIDYETNKLTYQVRSAQGGLVVFSEIWYGPDWQAYIDGEPADHVRGNYVLRVMHVPPGDHEVQFRIESTPYSSSRPVMFASSILLILLALGTIVWELRAWIAGRNPAAEVQAE